MDALGSAHPTDQTLRAYGGGKLDSDSADSVDAHLGVCSDCRQRVAELSADTFLGRLRDAQGQPHSPPPAGPSFTGLSRVDDAPGGSPHPIGSIPQDLADHPDYEILGELGRGGMGVVYLAENKLMARKEVLKVVSRELMDRRGVLDRFLREIRSAAQLNHPNIVTAYTAFRAGQSIVFAMEYIEGQDLARYVKTHGPLPVMHAAYFISQAALGLQYAHEKGLVHRDIKPSNLILATQQRRAVVKVLDFGLAKATREGPAETGLTRVGQMLGTPDYIAPEQSLDATKADIRADIYSLGCTLHYLLTSAPPFPGTSLYEVLQAHHSMEAKPLNLLRPDVPWELAAVVAKMMAKDPGRRYQTPGEVARALKPFFKVGAKGQVESTFQSAQVGLSVSLQERAKGGSVAANLNPAEPPGASAKRSPAHSGQRRPIRHQLIDIPDAESGLADARALEPAPDHDRPPWVRPMVAASVLTLGMVGALGISLSHRMRQRPQSRPNSADEPRVSNKVQSAPTKTSPIDLGTRADPPKPPTSIPLGKPEETRAIATPTKAEIAGRSPRRAEAEPAPPTTPKHVDKTAPDPKVVLKTQRTEILDIRQVEPLPGVTRLMDPDAEQPAGGFWPPLMPANLANWLIADPVRVKMRADGVTVEAGPRRNLLITQRANYKSCSMTLTMAATKGTEAFLALRAQLGPKGWQAVTARVYEQRGKIHVGHQSLDFQVRESGRGLVETDPGNPFVVKFQINDKNVARLAAKQRETSSDTYAHGPARDYVGAVGLFVKTGAVIIQHLDIQDL